MAGRQRLDARRTVPLQAWCGANLARAKAEAGRAEHRKEGSVVTGAAATLVAQVQPVAHGTALRLPLTGPEAAEVEQIARTGGNRQGRGEPMDLNAPGALGGASSAIVTTPSGERWACQPIVSSGP